MKWKIEKVDGVQLPFHSWPKVRGTIAHAVLELGSLARFDTIWDDILKDHRETAPIRAEQDEIDKDREKIYKICGAYFKRIKTLGIEIIETELKIDFDITDPKSDAVYSFCGTIDALAKFPTTPDGYVEVLDYKTGRQYSDMALNRHLQFGLYYVGLKYATHYNPNKIWWVNTNHFEPYIRKPKNGKIGDLRGPGFMGIKITDLDMLDYIVPQVMNIIELMKRPRYSFQASASSSAPCSHCEYATTGHCPSFEVGRTEGIEIQGMENMTQELLTDELIAKIGGMTDE